MSLAAYPGGLPEIKLDKKWKTTLRRVAIDSSNATDEELKRAVAEFIRHEHANRASQLPKIEWQSPDGQKRRLIEDGDIRQKFGDFIGLVAASHWWSHENLGQQLDRIIPAPPPFPTSWSIDL